MDDSVRSTSKQSEEASYLRSDSQSSIEKKTTAKKEDSTQQTTTGQQETAQQPEQSKANVGKTSSEVDDSVEVLRNNQKKHLIFVVIRNLV